VGEEEKKDTQIKKTRPARGFRRHVGVREEEETEFKDQVISIRRVTKVVKGGKNLSFSALVAVGNENGLVGIGKGKAREVPVAISKAAQDAKKKLIQVPIIDTTIPHFIKGIHGGGEVVLRPASKGTGVIAGGAVRVIMQLAGIKDILTKSIRSNNPISVANATMEGLRKLKNPDGISKIRGKEKDVIWQ
jgi:small subunit ribosomal protein S5